ncbi:PfkB family carbohydrate kinase [Pseudonocardia cypriaca]|uniref:Sugar/nucleoside kinase (Ribokinase family) n=1 Tax=Pseudonocardia cypriaca TaxID=882449 RepID=A0A543GCE9_9PSEU|nr:PfkB family carbohydrate kinase [Pseudonocardia cypriaca]TQM43757.1 sugar/nucleoside kinase (ribokinase family) [Pseudonocardia cypriaca]
MSSSRPRYDVVGGGAVSVDDLVFVDGSVGDGKGRVVRRERRFGGNAAVALTTAAEAGVRVGFVGHLPDDTAEPELHARMRAVGIDLSVARYSADTRPIRSTIIVGADGQRFIAFDDDTVLGLPEDLDLAVVRDAGVLLLDAYGTPGAIRAARAAREAGVPVVVDLEAEMNNRISELLGLADHVVLPVGFAERLTGAATPDEAAAALWRPDRTAVVLTAGRLGCFFRSVGDDRVHHRPAASVTVVDTTGCGDVFHGAYAAALTRGAHVAACVDAATASAGECATYPGGMRPLPESAAGT